MQKVLDSYVKVTLRSMLQSFMGYVNYKVKKDLGTTVTLD